jgi:hypothetical protein
VPFRSVFDFESMSLKEKIEVRASSEWPEIAKYFDEYHNVVQHNVSVHAHRMHMGLEPIGKVQYVGNTFVIPVHQYVAKEFQWEVGPDGISHKPSCEYRLSGYSKPFECHCGKRRERSIFKKTEECLPYKEEEVPF